ncbi:MAG: Asp-tRNA(Asn)/Glu-tRNA(Gln) amidotransferase subunit GatC [Alphaproteobacteria bacterium]|nr:MAG: Asp-tRNA(Asn)/Glu-tRNA(Gln) amidotransferase subunit GatC [Alphaproteobacteria bacterium]
MSIDKATVEKIAHLARIEISEEALGPMAEELSNILTWVEQLSKVDTEGVPAMTSVVDVRLPMREDVVTDGNCRDAILANAPKTDHGFFVVPKVIE